MITSLYISSDIDKLCDKLCVHILRSWLTLYKFPPLMINYVNVSFFLWKTLCIYQQLHFYILINNKSIECFLNIISLLLTLCTFPQLMIKSVYLSSVNYKLCVHIFSVVHILSNNKSFEYFISVYPKFVQIV